MLRRLIFIPLLVIFAAGCGETLTTVPRDSGDPVGVDGEGGTPVHDATSATADTTVLEPAVVDTLFDTSVSGFVASHRLVLADSEEWASVWAELVGPMLPEPPLPEVDFAHHRVVVLAMGERPSGGYDIGVRKIFQTADTTRVVVVETSPGASCNATTQVTTPALVLTIPALEGVVAFVEEEAVHSCG